MSDAASSELIPESVLAEVELRNQFVRFEGWLNGSRPAYADTANAYLQESINPVKLSTQTVRTFAPFRVQRSAFQTLTPGQTVFLKLAAIGLVIGLILWTTQVAVAIMAVITLFYIGNLLITFGLSARTLNHAAEIEIDDGLVKALAHANWPQYTILCPLYREASVVPQFAKAMQALDYPVNKLQILFLTEEDDAETRAAIQQQHLPPHFQTIIVPDGKPRTKPRACNYGLLKATGEYIVIYDAEDIPDPLQLKKAVLTFAKYGPELGCVQAKLNFYNDTQNLLTRWFTAEYSAWFELTLPGLQVGQFALPLGGTSNHFSAALLRSLGAWDVFNVTEDCDLGLRLGNFGLKTVVLASTTLEEANPNVRNWLRQRSRWIKGYMQTYLVHMRNPERFLRPSHWREFVSLQLIIAGRTFVLLVNPFIWAMLLIYILFHSRVEAVYHVLFPAPVLYMGAACLIFGNFLYMYTYFMGCIKRDQYHLVKWALGTPIYWLMGSVAAFIAFYQLITKPHYWEKTKHGLHLKPPATPVSVVPSDNVELPASAAPSVPVDMDTPPIFRQSIPKAAFHFQSPERSRRLHLPADRWLMLTGILSCLLGLAAVIYCYQNHLLLVYGDANAHLSIARRIIDSATPGIAQFGGVWLPLPHAAMVPFAQNDWLWHTGLAGACVSMPCYVITAVYLFLMARRLTHDSRASFVGALVFMVNPNILYLQTTPLSELIFIATMIVACYYFLAWAQDGNTLQLLPAAGITFLTTLARYDGWFICIALCGLVVLISLIKRQSWARMQANAIIFGTLAGYGIVLWMFYSAMIFGDPLYFQHGRFSSEASQRPLLESGQLYAYHNATEAFRYYMLDAIRMIGPGLLALSIVAAVLYVLRRRLGADALATLALWVPTAFYVFSQYTGQAVIYLPEAYPERGSDFLYNTRYAAVTAAPAAVFVAVFAAYLTTFIPGIIQRGGKLLRLFRGFNTLNTGRLVCVAVVGLIGWQSAWVVSHGVITLQGGQYGFDCSPPRDLTLFLAEYYSGGKVLQSTTALVDYVEPLAGIPNRNIVYEGSGKLWTDALSTQTPDVEWIIINPHFVDMVAEKINVQSPEFQAHFTLIRTESNGLQLYHRNSDPLISVRPVPRDVVDELNARRGCKY